MKIQEAIEVFKALQSQSKKKRETAIYKKFDSILSNLENRDLSDEQISIIEEKLDSLELGANPENQRKYYNGKLSAFTNFLKTTFSFVTQGYYTGLGVALGLSFGVSIGTVFGVVFGGDNGIAMGVALGPSFGMAIGIAIGAAMDAQAKKENRVI